MPRRSRAATAPDRPAAHGLDGPLPIRHAAARLDAASILTQ